MKTLVIFGAARKKGQTKEMMDLFLENIEGEVDIVDCYRTKVSPCVDCRNCWKERKCSINDDMQEIYKKVDAADLIVLASPMYFHSVTGPMKTLLDRFQVYWASEVRKDRPQGFIKKGVILMVGGARSFEGQFDGGAIVLKGLLHDFSAKCEGIVTFANTDRDRVSESEEIKNQLKEIAHKCISQ